MLASLMVLSQLVAYECAGLPPLTYPNCEPICICERITKCEWKQICK